MLCRLALRAATIDAATFTSIRVVSGAGILLLITAWTRGSLAGSRSWTPAAMLFLYAVPFSFAYARLSAGTGSLILFGAVQVTMLTSAAWSGERLRALPGLGVLVALIGLIYLVFPGLAAPPLSAAALMTLAGVAWGLYSLRGRGMTDPLAQTALNFTRAVPLVLLMSVMTATQLRASSRGVLLAAVSGAVTSGLGYVAWYGALRGLTATRAAVLQLAVPVLTAAAGVIFLMEPVSPRLIVASVTVIGGIALTLTHRISHARPPDR